MLALLGGCGYWLYTWQRDTQWRRALETDTIEGYEAYLQYAYADEKRKANARTRITQIREQVESAEARIGHVERQVKAINATLNEHMSRLSKRILRLQSGKEQGNQVNSALEDLRAERELLRRYVLEGEFASAIDDHMVNAQKLIRDNNYQRALAEYAIVERDYETLRERFLSFDTLARLFNSARRARAVWEHTKNRILANDKVPLARELDQIYKNVEVKLSKLEFVPATGIYKRLARDYRRLTQELSASYQVKKEAIEFKKAWERYSEENEITTSRTSVYAKEYSHADMTFRMGQFVSARDKFKSLVRSYSALKQRATTSESYSQDVVASKQLLVEYIEDHGLNNALILAYDQRFKEAQIQFRAARFEDASKTYSDLKAIYIRLLSDAKRMVANHSQAKVVRNELKSLVNDGWVTRTTSDAAETDWNVADNDKISGNYSNAAGAYSRARDTYNDLIAKAKNNRSEHNRAKRDWEEEIAGLEEQIDTFREELEELAKDIGRYQRKSDRKCDKAGVGDSIGMAVEGFSCELGCTSQQFNGVFYETVIDEACVNRCRDKVRRQWNQKMRKIRRCEEDRENARRRYQESNRKKRDLENEYELARRRLNSVRLSESKFVPL